MKNKLVGLDTIISQKEDIDVSDLNGEKVMMDLDKGKYFMLNETGSVIWDKITNERCASEIIDAIINEYDVDRDTCENKVLEYLEQLRHEELICVK